MSDYVINEWGPNVKLAHVELTKADIICKDYALEAVKLMSACSLAEVRFYILHISLLYLINPFRSKEA